MGLQTFFSASGAENGILKGPNTMKEALHCPGTLGKASYR